MKSHISIFQKNKISNTHRRKQILDEKLYASTLQPGYEELPIPNRVDYMKLPPEMNANQVSTFSSTPINSYSQYGASR
jgi:hypothetical protein